MKICVCCEETKEILAKGMCKPCYRKQYYQAHKDKEKESAMSWKHENRDRFNQLERERYRRSLIKKRCPRCNKQILINPKKTLVKCRSCGSKFVVSHTLSISNKNKHGLKLKPQ